MAAESVETRENKAVSKKVLKKLIEQGKKEGFLSYVEINEAISDDLKSSDQIDDIMVMFKTLGITLVDTDKSGKPKAKAQKKKASSAKSATAGKAGKTSKAGVEKKSAPAK